MKECEKLIKFLIAIVTGILILVLCNLIAMDNHIAPIEVYQGKTELYRTYNEQGELVDSIVVRKN